MRKRLDQHIARREGGAARSSFPAPSLLWLPLLFVLAVILPAASETAPTPTWTVLQNGAGHSYDYGNAVVTDSAGNVYVTGSGDDDFLTIKYGPNGTRQWMARYDGPGHGEDNALAVAVNDTGDVYVTGSSYGGAPASGGTDYDVTTVKYNAAGQEQWVRRFNGSGNQGDAARGLSLGPDGSVYITGYAWEAVSAWDFITLKYDADGSLRWNVGYDNGFGADRAAAIASDSQGNVYVTGESWGGASGFDYVTISYNSEGDRRWLDRYNGPQNGAESPTDIAAGADGSCWVTGTSTGVNNTDATTLRYDATGSRVWASRFNGSGNGPDIGKSLAVDGAGNSYVAGVTQTAQNGSDYLALKYGPTGVQLWSAVYNGASGASDQANDIAVRNGKVYVTGQSGNNAGGSGFATQKYSESGALLWTGRYEGPVTNFAGATGLALGADGSLAVVGSAWTTEGGLDYATLRYPAPAPAAPTNLTATASKEGVLLAWSHTGEDSSGYIIERKTGSGPFGARAAVGTSPLSYLDTQVAAGTTYSYRLLATGPGGDSDASNVEVIRTPGGIPGKITVSPAKINFGTVLVSKSKVKKIKIKNAGKGPLSGAVQLASGPFTITSGAGAFSLAPKASVTVTVSFSPAAAGTAMGALNVSSDDPSRPLVVVSLTAKGQ